MPPLAVVENLQLIEQASAGLTPGLVVAMHDEVGLERVEETHHPTWGVRATQLPFDAKSNRLAIRHRRR